MAVIEMKPTSRSWAASFDTQKAFAVPIGAASPLWLAFAGAAGAGLAYWWLTRWMRPANLEAWLSPAKAAEPALVVEPAQVVEAAPDPELAPEPMAEPEPALEALTAMVEAVPPPAEVAAETVSDTAEAIVEAAPEPPEPATPVVAAPKLAAPKASSRSAPKKS